MYADSVVVVAAKSDHSVLLKKPVRLHLMVIVSK